MPVKSAPGASSQPLSACGASRPGPLHRPRRRCSGCRTLVVRRGRGERGHCRRCGRRGRGHRHCRGRSHGRCRGRSHRRCRGHGLGRCRGRGGHGGGRGRCRGCGYRPCHKCCRRLRLIIRRHQQRLQRRWGGRKGTCGGLRGATALPDPIHDGCNEKRNRSTHCQVRLERFQCSRGIDPRLRDSVHSVPREAGECSQQVAAVNAVGIIDAALPQQGPWFFVCTFRLFISLSSKFTHQLCYVQGTTCHSQNDSSSSPRSTKPELSFTTGGLDGPIGSLVHSLLCLFACLLSLFAPVACLLRLAPWMTPLRRSSARPSQTTSCAEPPSSASCSAGPARPSSPSVMLAVARWCQTKARTRKKTRTRKKARILTPSVVLTLYEKSSWPHSWSAAQAISSSSQERLSWRDAGCCSLVLHKGAY